MRTLKQPLPADKFNDIFQFQKQNQILTTIGIQPLVWKKDCRYYQLVHLPAFQDVGPAANDRAFVITDIKHTVSIR